MEKQRSLFITPDEMRQLTGFALKAKQIEQLRRMGIAFFVNGCGKPVVTVEAIEGTRKQEAQQVVWQPAVLMKAEHESCSAGNTVRQSKGKANKTKKTAPLTR